MATTLISKFSTTSGSAPASGDLSVGEIALNIDDRKAYTRDSSNNVFTLGVYVDSVAPSNPVEGDLWYDTANNVLKAHNGSTFVGVSGTFAESDTLATVTARGAVTGVALEITNTTTATSSTTGALKVVGGVGIGENLHVGGNAVITGDLTVNGTTTTVNTTEVNIGDNVIILNADEVGTPTQNAGIEVERGTSTNKSFVWNETDGAWDLGGETLGNVIINGGTY